LAELAVCGHPRSILSLSLSDTHTHDNITESEPAQILQGFSALSKTRQADSRKTEKERREKVNKEEERKRKPSRIHYEFHSIFSPPVKMNFTS